MSRGRRIRRGLESLMAIWERGRGESRDLKGDLFVLMGDGSGSLSLVHLFHSDSRGWQLPPQDFAVFLLPRRSGPTGVKCRDWIEEVHDEYNGGCMDKNVVVALISG